MTSTATSTTTRATTAISTRATTVSHSPGRRNTPRADWGAYALVLLVGSTVFLFAGSYRWSLAFPALICVILLIAARPWRRDDLGAPLGALDATLVAIGVLIALQLLPLPLAVLDLLSPHARDVWARLSLSGARESLPLSIDRSSTVWALGVYAGAVATFFISRRIFAGGGVRIVARGVATIGLVLSAVCLAQAATAHGLIYWRWAPPFAVAAPFGPFLNRNHFATWAVMAVPMTFGYLLAHASVHSRVRAEHTHWRAGVLDVMDSRSIWLAAAICLMLVGLAASLSRAGMAAMLAALVLLVFLRARGAETPASGWSKAALAAAALLAIVRINPVELYYRFAASGAAASDRIAIWKATLPVVRDFWLTGTGAGTFETVMLAYEHTPSLFRINAAHNHYLQIVAEGGLLIAIPAAAAAILFVRAAWRALAEDRSSMSLLRIGAAAGLAGAAMQSLGETGLTTPANAVLAAALAAVVVHRSNKTARTAG